ncbi:MAG: lysophospholipid acyltransferase family protein [Halothiobacillus sp.]
MWWIPARIIRLQWHLAQGIWLVRSAHRRDPEVHAERVRYWLAAVLDNLNIRSTIEGQYPGNTGHLWLANHVSWLDVPLLGGLMPYTVFLSKEEIKHWPIIGALASGAGTLFMERGAGSEAARIALTEGLKRNRHVVIFPEGTTTAGHHVKRFHARLVQPALDAHAPVQPVALRYFLSNGRVDRRAAYIDDDSMLGSMWRILRAREIRVRVQFLEPIPASSTTATAFNRDDIARLAEQRIRAVLHHWTPQATDSDPRRPGEPP